MEEKECIPSSKSEVESEKPDRDIRILADFYSKHHLNGNRRNQSVSEEKRSQLFKEWMGKNKKVLDMGCRDGILTRHFIEHNEVTGLDIDKQALEACRENLKIETKWADFSLQIPIPTSSFDVVVAGEVIEHLPSKKQVASIKRTVNRLRSNSFTRLQCDVAKAIS